MMTSPRSQYSVLTRLTQAFIVIATQSFQWVVPAGDISENGESIAYLRYACDLSFPINCYSDLIPENYRCSENNTCLPNRRLDP